MLLLGTELVGYVQERQAKAVRRLRSKKIFPKLAIIQVGDDAASTSYAKAKQKYGQQIGVGVDLYNVNAKNLQKNIVNCNEDAKINGIIIQLPLPVGVNTKKALDLINANKDVDGLGKASSYEPATPTAILWLLAGYNVDIKDCSVLVIGQGRLVGKPLAKMLAASGVKVTVADEHTKNLGGFIKQAKVIVTAAGQPKLLTANSVSAGAVIIDAGTAEAKGKLVGDADPALYGRSDIKISPVPGGVGPLTVAALFENVIKAAS